MPDKTSHIVVVGAGGIGGTFAGLLSRTKGSRVTLLTRAGAHLDALRRDGLRLEGLAELTADVEAVDDASQLEVCDVLIHAVKAQDTEAALEATRHLEARELVTSLQNGVVKDEQLVGAFGADRVVGALTVVAGERPEPGVTRWTYDGGTQVGEFDGRPSERVDRLVARLQAAGLVCEASNAIVPATWTKLVGWAPIGLLATLSRQTNAGVLSNEPLARQYLGMVRELAALASAHDVSLLDLGPFHVASWLEQPDGDALGSIMGSTLAGSKSTHSALQDIQRGLPTELGATLGPLLSDAADRGIPMARVESLYAALMGLEQTLA
jgi:2-dehydropantoate 2-reductase